MTFLLIVTIKTKNVDMSPTSLRRKENLPVNPNDVQMKYMHIKNTNMK